MPSDKQINITEKNKIKHLVRDLIILAASLIFAVVVAKTDILKNLLMAAQNSHPFGSILTGMFFVSAFTAAPAAVLLAKLTQINSIFTIAFFGGLGALLGDLIIFRFVKNNLSEDILYLIKKTGSGRLLIIFHLKTFKWLVPFLGALIVASPLPDELGLMMMGFAKMPTSLFIPISFALNFSGIFILSSIIQNFI